MIAQDAFKRISNSYVDESGITFWMKPLYSLRVSMLHNSLKEEGYDSTEDNLEGRLANIFLYLEGYCVDIIFPDELPASLEPVRIYWQERGPLSIFERFMLFTESFDHDSYAILQNAWNKTRDASLSAPDELQEVPTDADDNEKKSAS